MFSRIVDERPNAGQALHFLGQVRLKLGRFVEAREPLERAAKFMPREPAAQTNLAGCLMQLGQHEAALEALARAAHLKPNDPVIAHNTGRTLEALARLDEAERAYDLALSIDNRLLPSLAARANLLAARGEWAGALADLDTALVSRPNDPQLRLRRGELLLRQGDWWRGLADHEARLEIAEDRYAPDLPIWQGEALAGPLLLYPEQADIDGDDAKRDTIMLARGIDPAMTFAVQCAADLAPHLAVPTVRRGDPVPGFAAAAPLRSLPHLLGLTLETLPASTAVTALGKTSSRIGWFTRREPPAGLEIERDPVQAGACRLVVGDDLWPAHLAASLGIRTLILLPRTADWLWGPRLGTSPWYASVELLAEDDSEGLAARLAGC
ncbi:MAG: tetratricopeptide repeat protein [Reyranella sp.]|nr:MAG: tetratricopeptide repeat protein [Reyranella sp.]